MGLELRGERYRKEREEGRGEEVRILEEGSGRHRRKGRGRRG